jgi:hypothetical protein
LVRLGQTICKSPEEFKAWSQNLGHEHVLTSLNSYGEVAAQRQGEIIKSLRPGTIGTVGGSTDEVAEAGVQKIWPWVSCKPAISHRAFLLLG